MVFGASVSIPHRGKAIAAVPLTEREGLRYGIQGKALPDIGGIGAASYGVVLVDNVDKVLLGMER